MLDNKILSTMSPERTLNTLSRRHQDGPNQVAAETIANGSVDNIQGVPYNWIHFVFVIFSGSRAHTEELFIAIG